jgi:NADH dehydrogenase [ubiquinone] 1 alpha subcomplex assembly factor 7
MAACLGDPQYGYYMTRDPLGRRGDFTTAPEISQMFGELLGFWAVVVWQQMHMPKRLNLVELGPGRGTLMADALRAAAGVPGFLDAVQVHLVETSPPMSMRCRTDR